MATAALCHVIRTCPRCGGEKMLRHSQVCGYCYETAFRDSTPLDLLRESFSFPELTVDQRADFLLGTGLAVGAGAVAVGLGALAAAWVLVEAGWSPVTLVEAALAFLGAVGVSFGSLTLFCLWRLRPYRPYAVFGVMETLLSLSPRQLAAWWQEVGSLREPDPWLWKEDEWS